MEKIENRYMFDTCALNRICGNPSDEMHIYQTKQFGWEYYFSEIQCDESGNTALNGLEDALIEKEKVNRAISLLRIIPKLQTKYIGLIATLRRNRWVLNGTYTPQPDSEQDAYDLFVDILNENDRQHYNDAMIGMTAIVHGCTIVTNDRRFYNKVNKHFPGRAIRYDEYMERVNALFGSTNRQ